MKEGWLVVNVSNSGDGLEILGIYRSRELAEKRLESVLRHRYPRMSRDEIDDYEASIGDSTHVIYYEEQKVKDLGRFLTKEEYDEGDWQSCY